MLAEMRQDLRAALERDPAARNALEVALLYPGVHAVWGHRVAHRLWTGGHLFAGRALSMVFRLLTGVEIHPGAELGPGLFIDHASGVVIGETAEVGRDVTLYHGVTLGGTSLAKGKRHPTIGDGVVVGTGAKILGAITIGENSRIGANAVVVKSVPPNSVVVGVPGQVVVRSKPRPAHGAPDLDHGQMPDLIGVSVASLLQRVETLEEQLHVHEHGEMPHHPDKEGVWHGEDFSI